MLAVNALLNEFTIDASLADRNGKTALQVAKYQGHTLIEVLIQNYIDARAAEDEKTRREELEEEELVEQGAGMLKTSHVSQ